MEGAPAKNASPVPFENITCIGQGRTARGTLRTSPLSNLLQIDLVGPGEALQN